MRLVPILAASLFASASALEHAHAQTARATVEVAATVVETAGVRVDAPAATITATRGGVRLAVPLAVSGAGSPSVAVAGGEGGRECQAVPAAEGRARGGAGTVPWLRCFVPRRAGDPAGVTEVAVTLLVVPAT